MFALYCEQRWSELLLSPRNNIFLNLWAELSEQSTVACHSNLQILILIRILLSSSESLGLDYIELDVLAPECTDERS